MFWGYDVERSGVGGLLPGDGAGHRYRGRRGTSYFPTGRQPDPPAGGTTARIPAIFAPEEAIAGNAGGPVVVFGGRQGVRRLRSRPEARGRP